MCWTCRICAKMSEAVKTTTKERKSNSSTDGVETLVIIDNEEPTKRNGQQ